MNQIFRGVMPAVTTKFNEKDELDLDLFAVNIKAQLEAGVHGIILGGTLGEASTLTAAEKRILVRSTVDLVQGKVPVILNIAEQSTSAAIHAAQIAKEDGARGLMLLPPMRYKADALETVTYFKAIAKSTDLPIMIYNNPVDYGIEVTLDMFESLMECENIMAVKESTRDISNVTRMRSRFGARFSILCGVDTLAMESLAMGADGWVAGLVCAFPAETCCIYELIKRRNFEDFEKAREIYSWFLPLLELDINTKLVQNIKLAETATGIGSPMVRAPRLPLYGEELEHVQQIIDQGLASRPVLPKYL
ncbi:MAG: dihydrodipicolinate synthase family protein [Flavobacteriaceae bacterium]